MPSLPQRRALHPPICRVCSRWLPQKERREGCHGCKKRALRSVSATLAGGGEAMAKAPLGTGQRFAALKSKLASRPDVEDPGALAAAIGRKTYGAKRMAGWAAKGRRKG